MIDQTPLLSTRLDLKTRAIIAELICVPTKLIRDETGATTD